MESPTLTREDRLSFVILAVMQSMLLLFLHKSIEHEFWPATDLGWLYALYAVVVGVPVFFYLGVDRFRERWTAIAAGIIGSALFVAGHHSGWLMQAYEGESNYFAIDSILSPLCVGIAIGLFLLSLYFRSWRQAPARPLDYKRLLENSWLNALTAAFLGLFTGVFWLLLLLWALLFKVINIDFFTDLFTEPEFIYPVTGLVGGFGLVLIRDRVGFIATVRRLCETLIRALLPLVAIIGLLFLAFLPFTGVGTLWQDGPGSVLLVWLLLLTLFFFNAELGDSDDGGYPKLLLWLVLLAVIVLPVHSALAAWGLLERVGEYGWTVSRLWAFFIEFFLAAYALGYAVLILWKRGLPLPQIRQWNTWVGLALGVLLIVVQGPVIDFRRISANDQLDRVLAGEADDFDARYQRFSLGPYGMETLKALQEHPDVADDTGLQKSIETALTAKNPWEVDPRNQHANWEKVTFKTPDGGPIAPDALKQAFAESETWRVDTCIDGKPGCIAIPITVNDGRLWVINGKKEGGFNFNLLYAELDGKWQSVGSVNCQRIIGVSDNTPTAQPEMLDAAVIAFKHNGTLYVVEPDIRYLQSVGLLPSE